MRARSICSLWDICIKEPVYICTYFPLSTSFDGLTPDPAIAATPLTIQNRDGTHAAFDGERIRVAIEKVYRAELALDSSVPLPDDVGRRVSRVTLAIIDCQRQRDRLCLPNTQHD